jgi:hypothetical protein
MSEPINADFPEIDLEGDPCAVWEDGLHKWADLMLHHGHHRALQEANRKLES